MASWRRACSRLRRSFLNSRRRSSSGWWRSSYEGSSGSAALRKHEAEGGRQYRRAALGLDQELLIDAHPLSRTLHRFDRGCEAQGLVAGEEPMDLHAGGRVKRAGEVEGETRDCEGAGKFGQGPRCEEGGRHEEGPPWSPILVRVRAGCLEEPGDGAVRQPGDRSVHARAKLQIESASRAKRRQGSRCHQSAEGADRSQLLEGRNHDGSLRR